MFPFQKKCCKNVQVMRQKLKMILLELICTNQISFVHVGWMMIINVNQYLFAVGFIFINLMDDEKETHPEVIGPQFTRTGYESDFVQSLPNCY